MNYSVDSQAWLGKAKKNKLYVSKLPRAFIFWCAFDWAKLKLWIFFACLLFFSVLWTWYRWKRHDRHNKTLWTTDFINSVFCLVSCSSKKISSIYHSEQSCDQLKFETSAAQKKKMLKNKNKNKTKTNIKKNTHLGLVFQSVPSFETYKFFSLALPVQCPFNRFYPMRHPACADDIICMILWYYLTCHLQKYTTGILNSQVINTCTVLSPCGCLYRGFGLVSALLLFQCQYHLNIM